MILARSTNLSNILHHYHLIIYKTHKCTFPHTNLANNGLMSGKWDQINVIVMGPSGHQLQLCEWHTIVVGIINHMWPPSFTKWFYKGFIWVQVVMTKYNGIWLTLNNIFVMRWVIFYLNICCFKTHQPHCHNIYTLYINTKGGFELSAWNTNPSPSIIFWDLKQCLACFSSYIPMACYMLFWRGNYIICTFCYFSKFWR